jgi:hypothetical protein
VPSEVTQGSTELKLLMLGAPIHGAPSLFVINAVRVRWLLTLLNNLLYRKYMFLNM